MADYKIDASGASRERLEAYLAECRENYDGTVETLESGYMAYDRDRRLLLDSADHFRQEITKVEKELDRRDQRGKTE